MGEPIGQNKNLVRLYILFLLYLMNNAKITDLITRVISTVPDLVRAAARVGKSFCKCEVAQKEDDTYRRRPV